MFCRTKQNRTKSRSWVFPDGTSCHSKLYNQDDISFCISGKCEKFSCENTTSNYFRIDPKICSKNYQKAITKEIPNKWMHYNHEYGRSFSSDSRHMQHQHHNKYSDSQHPHMYKYSDTNSMSKYSDTNTMYKNSDANSILRKSDFFTRPASTAYKMDSEKFKKSEGSGWVVKSGCHFGCMHKGKGIQVVSAANNGSNNIQLCSPKYKVYFFFIGFRLL